MILETYLLQVPVDAEECLAALACVQELLFVVGKREIAGRAVVACPNVECRFLFQGLERVLLLEEGEDAGALDDFDLVFQFDMARARAVAPEQERHLTNLFGVLLGVDPSSLPNVAHLSLPVGGGTDVVFLDSCPGVEVLRQWTETNFPELTTSVVAQSLGRLEDRWKSLRGARLVVGVRSVETYLAAAAGAVVVEIYPNDHPTTWLSKWQNRNYRMLYANPAETSPAMVWRVMEDAWRRARQSEDFIIRTERSTFAAPNAEK